MDDFNLQQIPLFVRDEFKNDVKDFCISNNVEYIEVENKRHDVELYGNYEDIDKVFGYNKKLYDDMVEKHRKSKSFLWRIFN